ncbi:MAG: class I SAM-dependent methyltransferase [Janthinobacterium lividum]
MSNAVSTPEDDVQHAARLLSAGETQQAEELATELLRTMPAHARLHMIRAVAREASGRIGAAYDGYWQTLAADPCFGGARTAVLEAALRPHTAGMNKNFALGSGERQVAGEIANIRADHRARYAGAALWLNQHVPDIRRACGLDVFCGNGYGSRMLADLTGARMLGVDGSFEAVGQAQRQFGSHRVVYGQAFFPFSLTEGLFGFATCLESAEHVADPHGLLQQLSQATEGPLVVSVPLEEQMPFEVNKVHFKHHTRHFTVGEIRDLLAAVGRPVIAACWGQRAYNLKNREIDGLLPPERMALTPLNPDSQFLLAIACKA